MGSSQSAAKRIDNAKKNINTLRFDVNRAYDKINSQGNYLVKLITERNYVDMEKICREIGYHKVDELAAHFPIDILDGVRIRLGINVEPNEEMVRNKNKVCKSIVDFYVKKIHLIKKIQEKIAICKSIESDVYNDLSGKLQREGINTEEWINVYKKVQRFNGDIKFKFNRIDRGLELIRRAQTKSQLDSATKNIEKLLKDTTGICEKYQTDLLKFTSEVAKIKVPTRAGLEEAGEKIRRKPLPVPEE